jgi:hypothetical protein
MNVTLIEEARRQHNAKVWNQIAILLQELDNNLHTFRIRNGLLPEGILPYRGYKEVDRTTVYDAFGYPIQPPELPDLTVPMQRTDHQEKSSEDSPMR